MNEQTIIRTELGELRLQLEAVKKENIRLKTRVVELQALCDTQGDRIRKALEANAELAAKIKK